MIIIDKHCDVGKKFVYLLLIYLLSLNRMLLLVKDIELLGKSIVYDKFILYKGSILRFKLTNSQFVFKYLNKKLNDSLTILRKLFSIVLK